MVSKTLKMEVRMKRVIIFLGFLLAGFLGAEP